MVNVLRSLMYIFVAIASPTWFPIIQKFVKFEAVGGMAYFQILLTLIAPIIVLYYCERQDKKTRINELVDILKRAGMGNNETTKIK